MSNDTRSRPMTAEVELLPLVGTLRALPEHVQGVVQAYARANVAHHTAAQRAEVNALSEELASLKYENERLREALKDADNELDWLDEDMDTCDHSVGVCTCDYWNMRRKMKAALSKENSND